MNLEKITLYRGNFYKVYYKLNIGQKLAYRLIIILLTSFRFKKLAKYHERKLFFDIETCSLPIFMFVRMRVNLKKNNELHNKK